MDKFGIVYGGDQLTHVRLAGAKQLRQLSPDKLKRFDHFNPFVIEMWHVKQDLLEVILFPLHL
jgi:hypothetical protein